MAEHPAPESPADRLSRRAVLRILGGALALALASRFVGRPPETVTPGEVPPVPPTRFDPSRLASPLTYRGTATTTILASGPDAGGRDHSTVERNVTVTLAPPRAVGGVRETNPFGLRVDATPARVEGVDRVASAAVVFDVDSGESSLVQFWDVRTNGDEGRFVGTLRDPSPEAVPGYNVLNTFREFVPGVPGTLLLATESIVGGTALRGRVTETDVELAVSGNTLNTFADDALALSRAF